VEASADGRFGATSEPSDRSCRLLPGSIDRAAMGRRCFCRTRRKKQSIRVLEYAHQTIEGRDVDGSVVASRAGRGGHDKLGKERRKKQSGKL
jgi:hypothetical protein